MLMENIILKYRAKFLGTIFELVDDDFSQRTTERSLGSVTVNGISYPYYVSVNVRSSHRSGEEEPIDFRVEYYYTSGPEVVLHNDIGPATLRYNVDSDEIVAAYLVKGEPPQNVRYNRYTIKANVNSDLDTSYLQFIDLNDEITKTYSRSFDKKELRYVSRLHYPLRDHSKGPSKFISFYEDGFKEREYLYLVEPNQGSHLHRTDGPAYEYNRAGMKVRKAGAFYWLGEDVTNRFGYHTWESNMDDDLKDFAWLMAMGTERDLEGYKPKRKRKTIEINLEAPLDHKI